MKYLVLLLSAVFTFTFLSAQTLAPTESKVLAKISVTDFEGNPRPDEVIIFENAKGQRAKKTTNEEGTFQILLPKGQAFKIKYQSLLEEKEYTTVKMPSRAGKFNMEFDVQMQRDTNTTFSLDVHFVTAKAEIYKESFPEIVEVSELMLRKKRIKIEIAGHTDSDGSEASNLDLSRRRAAAIKDMLVQLGVDESRMTTVGYGESKPIADNDTDEGKAINRRTEVRVIQ